MKNIFKTKQKATYFQGNFYLRDKTQNWATPIDFPTVFTAYGAGIRSGNWQSCTTINAPDYVKENYFNGRDNAVLRAAKTLENITWQDVKKDKNNVLSLINAANNELLKLETL